MGRLGVETSASQLSFPIILLDLNYRETSLMLKVV